MKRLLTTGSGIHGTHSTHYDSWNQKMKIGKLYYGHGDLLILVQAMGIVTQATGNLLSKLGRFLMTYKIIFFEEDEVPFQWKMTRCAVHKVVVNVH